MIGFAALVRVAVLAAVGLALLTAGCASAPVQTAAGIDPRSWEWCDRVQQGRPTVVCFQR